MDHSAQRKSSGYAWWFRTGRRRALSSGVAASVPGFNRLAYNLDSRATRRTTYEGFAAAWPSREGEFADKFNNMPKYVVSSTLDEAEWNNSTVLAGDAVE